MAFLKAKHIIFCLALVIISGCSKYVIKKPYFGYQGNVPYSPIDRFRWEVCVRILQDAYINTDAFSEIRKKDDVIHPTDIVYDKAYYNAIDSISKSFLYNSPATTFIRGAEEPGSKFIYGNKTKQELENEKKDYYIFAVLNFYESFELDSLARHYLHISDKEYSQYLKRLEKAKK